ncbi:uncharacterized protein PITG_09788 [Phytophthora infestans T30-4]|uniref:Uncharacterized protein n=1 Tax=Phytophthora infestans (strain T30-4) TaxID=403677 RepID=D0NCU1_PHYIT|nr:uncharacterized protein PITG_09788 [Phytophthora infestans T30-4]EEY55805.1 conserved hypothetical protein [Phytophthora infestans T30-4]|eukprot:XP_002903381.1 conserved hypothetical protein [Phytophthora infestans T30-4]
MTLNNDSGPSAKVHLSKEDYGLLVTWMEIPENFAAAHGTSKKTTVSRGSQKTKTQAFNELAVYLNTHTKTSNLPTLTGANVQQRWRTYKTKKFQPTLKKSRTETGLGMSKKEMRQGFSIQGKLDKLCPHFARMEKLFATRDNVRAPATLQLGSLQQHATGRNVSGSKHGEEDKENRFKEINSVDSGDDSLNSSGSDPNDQNDDPDGPAAGGAVADLQDDDSADEQEPSDYEHEASNLNARAIEPDNLFEPTPPEGALWTTEEEDELLSVPFMLALLGNAALDHSPRQPQQRTDAPAIGQSGPHLVASISTEPTALPEASRTTVSTTHPSFQRGRSRSKLLKRKSQAPDTNSGKTKPQKKKKRSSSGSSDSIDKEKPKRMTAHESRASLSFAYAKNGEDKINYMKKKLELDEKMWKEQRNANKAQQERDQQLRTQELKERRAARRHDMFMSLVAAQKTPDEIKTLMDL